MLTTKLANNYWLSFAARLLNTNISQQQRAVSWQRLSVRNVGHSSAIDVKSGTNSDNELTTTTPMATPLAGAIRSDGSIVPQEPMNEIMQRVIKNDRTMDHIWDMHMQYDYKKPYNQISDAHYEAHKALKFKFEFFSWYPWDFSWPGILRRVKLWIKYREENQQKFYAKRYAILGPDLAIAHFVIFRGGRVRFRHDLNQWATSLWHFPRNYDPRYQLLSVDASNLKLRTHAIDNFTECESLEELDLSSNTLDDWSCDRLSRLFRNKNLQSLDLSNNPLITHRGIECLHWIRSLKTLKITGTNAAKDPFIELLILNFNDLVPECQVIIK